MICEECGKNTATVSITLTTGSETKTRHLCPECMKKVKLNLASGNLQGFLSSVLAVLGTKQKPEEPGPTCSVCGHTYAEFEHTGRLGCAQCYRAFSQQLRPMLQRIHGHVQHAGRRPAAFVPDPRDELERTLQTLRQQMDQAVADENFEEAARLRDEIRTLTKAGEEAHE